MVIPPCMPCGVSSFQGFIFTFFYAVRIPGRLPNATKGTRRKPLCRVIIKTLHLKNIVRWKYVSIFLSISQIHISSVNTHTHTHTYIYIYIYILAEILGHHRTKTILGTRVWEIERKNGGVSNLLNLLFECSTRPYE